MAQAGMNPLSSIPERGSSRNMLRGSSAASMFSTAPYPPPPVSSYRAVPARARIPRTGTVIQPRGSSTSPIRRPNTSNLCKAPSRTFVPSVLPINILEVPKITLPRVNLQLCLSSPVYVGGATVEGDIRLAIDGGASLRKRHKSRSALSLSRISVTIVGIERCRGRQEIFRALTSELIDEVHPPPSTMLPVSGSDGAWDVAPSKSVLPFRLDLPVFMGPPPYKSRKAGISYRLSASIFLTIDGKTHFARQSQEIGVLTVHDPEKALVNLPNPLLVSDILYMSKQQIAQTIKLSAGLHRQTWISGYPVFVQILVENDSSKAVKKIVLQLERITLFHEFAAASSDAKPADVLRLPDHVHKEILVEKRLTDGFDFVCPQSEDSRTCQMVIPPNLVLIETGRYFGVRFFLNIEMICTSNKHLKVQLPITIIHPNSIDIPPNALAQVAAAIEQKHRKLSSASGSGSPYRYRAGQAFQAARRQSYLQLRKDTIGSQEMEDLARAIEGSPRKMARPLPPQDDSHKKHGMARHRSAAVLSNTNYDENNPSSIHHRSSLDNARQPTAARHYIPRSSIGSSTENHQQSQPMPMQPLRAKSQRTSFDKQYQGLRRPRSSLERHVIRGLRPSSDLGARPVGPRLQRSTSGLAFDDSEGDYRTGIHP